MGAPPSLNLIREILRLVAILNSNKVFSLSLALIAGLAVAYTLILYARSQQGQTSTSKTALLPLSLREISLIALHALVIFILRAIVNLII